MKVSNKKVRGRQLFILGLFVLAFLVLIVRLFWLQVVRGSWLSQKAYQQQTRDSLISPGRGTIYDTNGKVLATSATVETIVVTPSSIKTDEKRQLIAKFFSENFGLDYEETLEKVSNVKKSSLVLMKKVEKDVTNKVREFINNENIKGIGIIEDTKRYYPYNNLASHLLGFCGTDNQGLYGIELKYENMLKGVPGKIVTTKDANNVELPIESETYINAEDGLNLVLSIDEVIQHTAEKYLEQAIKETKCEEGGSIIVMRPKTGEILAMTSKPDFNLNDPFTPIEENVLSTWDSLSAEEKVKIRNNMWRNNAISKTYEPGSTFKLITAAIAVEENIVDPEAVIYNCGGNIKVGGAKINCWRYYNPHGSQNLRQGLQNSCNPVFIQTGLKIGTSTFYKYLRSFGLMETTGIDLPSESGSNFHQEEKVGPVELATLAFGQRFEITPLQLITSISAIANEGKLMKPYIVKEIQDSEGNVVEKTEPTVVRQVISKKTSDKMLDMMESVVSIGTGKNAQVAGFKVGGKTGTGEQGIGASTKYVASFVGVAPTTNPEVVVLVVLREPKGYSRQGGTIAAPVAGKVLTEVLDYLEITPDYEVIDNNSNDIQLPDVRTKTIAEAIKILENLGLKPEITFDGDKNTAKVANQMPVTGTLLKRGSIVKLYAEGNDVRVSVEVPNLSGLTASEAQAILKEKSLNMRTSGAGMITSQDPPAGTQVEQGTIVRVELKNVDMSLE